MTQGGEKPPLQGRSRRFIPIIWRGYDQAGQVESDCMTGRLAPSIRTSSHPSVLIPSPPPAPRDLSSPRYPLYRSTALGLYIYATSPHASRHLGWLLVHRPSIAPSPSRTSSHKEPERVCNLERLPGCAPDLNPDEGIWHHLKHVELRNLFVATQLNCGRPCVLRPSPCVTDATSSPAALPTPVWPPY